MKPCLDKSSLQHIKYILAGSDFRNDEKFLLEQKKPLLKIYNLSCKGSIPLFTTAITTSEINTLDNKNPYKVQENNKLINTMNIQILKAPFMLDDPLARMDMPDYVLDGVEEKGLYKKLISKGIQHADARHITVAESNECSHFITTDKKLINTINNCKSGLDINLSVINPKDFMESWKND